MRKLVVAMRGTLPEDFDPTKINARFCANGRSITLLGRAILDSNDPHVQQVNLVARSIRDMLIQRPDRTQITASEIAKVTDLPEQEVAIILEEMAGYKGGGFFHNSGTSYGRFGWASITVDDDVLKRYIKFESVEKLLNNVLKQ